MEHNVVTLDTAKKLKAAGFEQSAIYCWYQHPRYDGLALGTFIDSLRFGGEDAERYAAPTAQEIADQLPTDDLYSLFPSQVHDRVWVVQWGKWMFEGDTMAEALAVLYLKLHASPATPNQSDGGEV